MWNTGYYGYLSDYLAWWLALLSLIVHAWCFFRFVPRGWRPVWRLVLGNALVFLCMFVFAGLIAETWLRFVGTATDSYGATLTSKRWQAAYARTNSLGHRDEEWTEAKPPGVTRIAFFGDSFVYGWGINDPRDRFTELIQSYYDKLRPGAVAVMNVAWAGWGTRDHLRWLPRIVKTYQVDRVILCYLPNDIEAYLPVSEAYDPTQPLPSRLINTESSFLVNYLHHRVYAHWVRGARRYFDWLAAGFEDPQTWNEHAADLIAIARTCRELNVSLGVVILPFLKTTGDAYDPRRVHAQVASVFASHGVAVLDLSPVLAGHDPDALRINAHDYHPNEQAHRLFAEAIWLALLDMENARSASSFPPPLTP